MENKTLIMVPYAFGTSGIGENIKRYDASLSIYLKNCCGALITAKQYNHGSDVALVTNIKEIPHPYKEIFDKNGIIVIFCEFNEFLFPDEGKWRLAFYKLCALSFVVNNFDYDYYSYFDTDIIVQSSFDNIWKECGNKVLLYDICQGLQVKDYILFNNECESFLKVLSMDTTQNVTRYGGEFFAGSKKSASLFVSECLSIFKSMIAYKIRTSKGDEFIISLFAHMRPDLIKNAGAYIFRFWTGSFRLISTSYINQPVTILHVQGEKENGMISLYDYFWKKGKSPSKKQVWKKLHILKPSFITRIKIIAKRILKK